MDRDINRSLCVASENSNDRTTENCLYLYKLKITQNAKKMIKEETGSSKNGQICILLFVFSGI